MWTYARRSEQELQRMVALGPKAAYTNVVGYDMACELLELRAQRDSFREALGNAAYWDPGDTEKRKSWEAYVAALMRESDEGSG